MTQTRAINAAADVICRAMAQGRAVPAALAFALDAAGMLQSPESAAEVARLRQERQSTNSALAEVTLALRAAEAERDALTEKAEAAWPSTTLWQLEVLDGGLVWLGTGLRADSREAAEDLLTQNRTARPDVVFRVVGATTTYAAMDEPTELVSVVIDPDSTRLIESTTKLRGLLARTSDSEDPHDGPLHHDYAVGRDLPEVRP